jgi:hypothetical protein
MAAVTLTSSADLAEAASRSACAAFTVAGADAKSACGEAVQNQTPAMTAAETTLASNKPNALRMGYSFYTLKMMTACPLSRCRPPADPQMLHAAPVSRVTVINEK